MEKLHNKTNHGSTAVMPSELAGFTHVEISGSRSLIPVCDLEPHPNRISYPGALCYRTEHPIFDRECLANIVKLVKM